MVPSSLPPPPPPPPKDEAGVLVPYNIIKWKALLFSNKKKIVLLLGIVMAIKQNLSTDFTMIINEVSESNNINNNYNNNNIFYISSSNNKEKKISPQTSSSISGNITTTTTTLHNDSISIQSSSSNNNNSTNSTKRDDNNILEQLDANNDNASNLVPSSTNAKTTATTNSNSNNYNDMESTSTREATKNDENVSVVSSPFRKAIDSFIMVPTTKESSFLNDIKEERQKELINYWMWHDEMIHKFPGSQVLTNPNGPNITIKYFDPNNKQHRGGLSDRLNDIGHQIRNAIREKHLLFIKWYDAPYQLEEFLIPNLINWTLPYHDVVATPTDLRNWAKNVNNNNNNNNNITSYNNATNVNKHHNHREIRLMPKIKDVEFKNPFGLYWYSLFRPSTRVQQQIDKSLEDMSINPGNYDAIHMRIGHPGFRHYTKFDKGNAVDTKGGDILAMKVISREYVLNYTNHAFSCLQLAVHDNHHHKYNNNNNNNNQKKEDNANANTTSDFSSSPIMKPIYFFADSTELVNTMIQNASDYYYNSNDKDKVTNNNVTDLMSVIPTKPNKNDNTLEEARLESAKKQLVEWKKHVRVVGRRSSSNAHTQQDSSSSSTTTSNKNNNVTTSAVVHLEYKTAPIEAHVNTFVDLYLAIQARCIAVGVGRFGYMAGKISGTKCWTLHHDFPNPYLLSVWGLKKMVKDVPNCPIEI